MTTIHDFETVISAEKLALSNKPFIKCLFFIYKIDEKIPKFMYVEHLLNIIISYGYKISNDKIIELFNNEMPLVNIIHFLSNLLSTNKYLSINNSEYFICDSIPIPKIRKSYRCPICVKTSHYSKNEYIYCKWEKNIQYHIIEILDSAIAIRSAIKNKQITMDAGIICMNYMFSSELLYTPKIFNITSMFGFILDYLLYRINVPLNEIETSILFIYEKSSDEFEKIILK